MTLYRQTCPSGSVPYIIREGDLLALIAKQYNSNVEDILLANPTINPNNLKIGEQICIPLPVQLYPSCPTTNYYIVTKTDTFQSIANYFNVTELQLLYANYGIDPNDLYEDQILCIPVSPSPIEILINTNTNSLYVYKNGSLLRTYLLFIYNSIYPGNYIILNKQVEPRFLGLSEPGLGIHGIDNINKAGITLTNEAISELFNLVSVGTPITII